MLLDPMNPDVAYAVGLLQTDGHHDGDVTKKGRIQLELNAVEAPLLEDLRAVFPCYTSLRRRTRATNFAVDGGYETVTLGLYDQAVRRELARLGVTIGRKSLLIVPPDVPYSRPDYWRGVVDGDGSLGFAASGRPFVSLVTASPGLARAFESVIADVCGVARNTRPNTRDGVMNIMVQSRAAVALARWLYPEGARLASRRKRECAAAIAAWTPPSDAVWRYDVVRRAWTPAEDAVALSLPIAEAAEKLGRTMKSVQLRRMRLRRAARLSETAVVPEPEPR